MNIKNHFLVIALFVGFSLDANAYIPPNRVMSDADKKLLKERRNHLRDGLCKPSESFSEMNINNVRARLLGGGDMWWDLDQTGKYEIPKVEPGSGQESVSAIFAGSVWVGGFDPSGSLKIAAEDYRNANSNEWWPGPLDNMGNTNQVDCENWDQHFTVYGSEIREHIANFRRAQVDSTFEYTENDIPLNVKTWPARGNEFFVDQYGFELPNTPQGLGLFFEPEGMSNNGIYEPHLGDYPMIDIRGCQPGIYADQMVFWIYNDAGNIHTNTRGDAIQLEVQAQSFGFQTTDPINDMTFYRYKLINRASQQIDSCFFALWVDPDLGCYTDDYIGCDSARSLMYTYNVDEIDGTIGCECSGDVATYCDRVPILGIDFFQGPQGPKVLETLPNGKVIKRSPKLGEDFDLIEELSMSSFTYYGSGLGSNPPGMGDPTSGRQFFNYLSGTWADGTRLTKGGTGYNPNSTDYTSFAFSDPPDLSGGWSMCEEGLSDADRKTLQACGPMRLDPSTINELIVGVIWVPDQVYPCPSLNELYAADDRAQSLFDDCFRMNRGPDAPNVDLIELDQEIILVLTNETRGSHNNGNETYKEKGTQIPTNIPESSKFYEFEGYRIFQVSDLSVSKQELNDETKAREIFTVDIKNGIKKMYNWVGIENPDPTQPPIYIPQEQVVGTDNGIQHTFKVTTDAFAPAGDTSLVNHKDYYYYVIAYAHNNFEQFDPKMPLSTQKTPYLPGRLNVGDSNREWKAYKATPRPILFKKLNASFGDGADITRFDGVGVGGNFLDISEETEERILDGTFDGTIVYEPGRGPIEVKVFNPLEIKDGIYELRFSDEDDGDDQLSDPIRWLLTNSFGDSIWSERSLATLNEQVIHEFGFSLNIGQTNDAGDFSDGTNGLIGVELDYKDENALQWFTAVHDGLTVPISLPNGQTFNFEFDFIRDDDCANPTNDPFNGLSQGIIVPYLLTSSENETSQISPAWKSGAHPITVTLSQLNSLNNVDVVFTKDKSKWSRCIVVETATKSAANAGFSSEGNASNFNLRAHPSIGKDVDGDGNPAEDGDGMGMSWFPGYAIDVETGKRLNIFFGENSAYGQAVNDFAGEEVFDEGILNATDMIWNPSSQMHIQELIDSGTQSAFPIYLGGKHFIYVTDMEYDECASLRVDIGGGQSIRIARALTRVQWTCMPLTLPGTKLLSYEEGLIPNDVKLKMRVDNPYNWYEGTADNNGNNFYQFEFKGSAPGLVKNKEGLAKALDKIGVVPNPYYGYSEYETSQGDNVVKITNLPDRATVTIYSLDGRFVKHFDRDEVGNSTESRQFKGVKTSQTNPNVTWDLRNNKGTPVTSGTYLIHIIDKDTGEEKTVKWFGIQRHF